MILKRHLANMLQHLPPLRWGLALGVRFFAPRTPVGAVAVILNDAGQILMVEHVFRPGYAWGLPGGWVNRGEDPAQSILREVEEELNLKVEVKKLLLCEPQGKEKSSTAPLSLGLAYYCRLADGASSLQYIQQARAAYEVLSARWVQPAHIDWALLPLQQKAIVLALQEFEAELLLAKAQDQQQ